MLRSYHIAADIGSGSGRLFAGWLEEGKIKTEEIHRFETGEMILLGKHVRDLYRWQEEVVAGIRKFVQRYGPRLTSIGVDSMGDDMVLLDEEGNVLVMPLAYREVVASPEVLKIEEERMGDEEIYRRCGNQNADNDPLRQLITLRLRSPGLMKRVGGMLFFGDAFHYFLCGRRATEYTLSNYSKLFNQHTQNWDEDIFSAFDLPEAIKMPIVRCGEKLGELYPGIAEDVGLEGRTEVIAPSIHDSACAAFATPDEGDDWMFISNGSWAIIGMQTEKPIINHEAWRFNCSNSGMPMDKNMFKKLVAGMWIMQGCRRDWPDCDDARIVELAAQVENNRFYFDPDDPAFFNPDSMTAAVSQFIFERYNERVEPSDVARIARVCMESLALKYGYAIKRLQRIAQRRYEKLYILGGGSRNALLNQMTANVSGMTVYTGVYEASVAGNLLVQMIGSGELSGAREAKRVLIDSFPLTRYAPRDAEIWSEKYRNFLEVTGLEP